MSVVEMFDLKGGAVVITGAAGLLGRKHAEAVLEIGGLPILWDINENALQDAVTELNQCSDKTIPINIVDITNPEDVRKAAQKLKEEHNLIGLVNNAANNPQVKPGSDMSVFRLENFPLDVWDADMNVGLKGAMICAREFGQIFAEQGKGSIVNVASDLGIIAPDQRLYSKPGLEADKQPVKPVTYSVTKHGLIGLTRYIATYWADNGVRCNAIAPGGVQVNQDQEFLDKIEKLIPLGRMARADEYKGIIAYLCSDASSYMNGSIISVDGGRSVW